MSQPRNANQDWTEIFNVKVSRKIAEMDRLDVYVGVNTTKTGDVRVFVAKVDRNRGFARNFTVFPPEILDAVINGLQAIKPEIQPVIEEARKQKTLSALQKLGVSIEDLRALVSSNTQ